MTISLQFKGPQDMHECDAERKKSSSRGTKRGWSHSLRSSHILSGPKWLNPFLASASTASAKKACCIMMSLNPLLNPLFSRKQDHMNSHLIPTAADIELERVAKRHERGVPRGWLKQKQPDRVPHSRIQIDFSFTFLSVEYIFWRIVLLSDPTTEVLQMSDDPNERCEKRFKSRIYLDEIFKLRIQIQVLDHPRRNEAKTCDDLDEGLLLLQVASLCKL